MSMWSRVKNVFRGDRVSLEIDEEFASHIEHAVADGYGPAEARKAFGPAQRWREVSREARVVGWMDSLRADVVFGWRQLWKRKVTTTAAVLSLGLAIGSCVAAFRLVDALFLRAMPVNDPASLYEMQYTRMKTDGLAAQWDSSSYPFYMQVRESVKGQVDVDAVTSTVDHNDVSYGSDAETEKAYTEQVSGGLFGNFGLTAALGRLLTVQDDRTDASPVAVISYDYWARRFGRDPKVIGQRFHMNDNLYEIVGVGPRGFTGTEPGTITEMFAPLMADAGLANDKNSFFLRIFLRVRPGVDVKALESKLNTLNTNWEIARIHEDPKQTVRVKLAGGGISGLQTKYGEALTVMTALVGLVLLIACANVASLMNAQAAARAREMALRMSLGCGRLRLVRMVMVESAMLGVMAASLGLGFAWWATPFVLSRINPADNPARLVLSADWAVIGFGVALGMGVTLLFGLAPALRASGVKPASAMKGGEEPHARLRWMYSAIAGQVAFCFVVLFVAGLFMTTFAKLLRQPMGFTPEHVLLLDTTAKTQEPAVKWDQMTAAVRSVPGVQAAAMEDWALMSGTQHNDAVYVNGAKANEKNSYFLAVSPGWLDTMRVPMLAGRDFRDDDTKPGAAIVNESFMKRNFGSRNPIGQTFEVRPPKGERMKYEVVGLVRDAAYRDVREAMLPQAYVPIHRLTTASANAPPLPAGTLQTMRDEMIAVRMASGDPMQMAELLRQKVTETDGDFRVSTIRVQADLIANQMLRERMLATLAGFFAVVALLLATIGLYGVLSYSVVQREKEIGIRIALGAAAANITRLVTGRVFAMVLAGAPVGLIAGMASVRFVEALLYGVKRTDVGMMVLPGVVLLGAAGLAALPAVLRAVSIDPAVLLRAE